MCHPHKVRHKGIDEPDQAQYTHDDTQIRDQFERFHAKGGDAVNGEADHLLERIFGLARTAFLPFVVYIVAAVADERHNAPQEQVDLPILRKGFKCFAAQQTVVGVVVDNIHAQHLHKLIVALCGGTLKEGVFLAAVPHTIHHLTALHILVNKLVNDFDIVL